MNRMRTIVTALAAASFSAALSGCVASDTVIAGYSDGPSQIGFSVVDARPNEDRTTKMLSDWATSCDNGIIRMGDDSSSPARLAILRQDIEDNLGGRVANTTLTVTRYRMFLNRSRQTIAATASRGVVGALMAPNCTRENTTAGWYDPGETANFNSPIVVEIEARFQGREYEARAVSSPAREIAGADGLRKADGAPAVYAAMEKANLVLIARLRRALSGNETSGKSQRSELALLSN